MKCPACVKEGKKSTIYDSNSCFRTAAADYSYYDEDGKHHHHDPNTTTIVFNCSNGHQIAKKIIQRCCDKFPGLSEMYIDGKKWEE